MYIVIARRKELNFEFLFATTFRWSFCRTWFQIPGPMESSQKLLGPIFERPNSGRSRSVLQFLAILQG